MNNNSVLEAKIDGLAGAVSKGFEEVHEKLKEMGADIVEVKKDISGIKQRLTNIDNRLDTMADHERRITKLEKVVEIGK